MGRDRERRRAYQKAYNEARREQQRAYDAQPERRAARAAYKATEAGQAAEKRYRQGTAGRATRQLAAERVRRGVVADRQAAIDALKLDHGCADCGYADHAIALDFDHVRGEKVANVSKMVKALVDWDLVLAEIEKCDVVCANCHRVRTQQAGHYINRTAKRTLPWSQDPLFVVPGEVMPDVRPAQA